MRVGEGCNGRGEAFLTPCGSPTVGLVEKL